MIDGWLLEGEHNIALKTLGTVVLRKEDNGEDVTCVAYKSYHASRGDGAMFLAHATIYPTPQREYPQGRALPLYDNEELEDIFDFHCIAYHNRNNEHPKFVTGESREKCIDELISEHWMHIEPSTHLYLPQVLNLTVNEKEDMLVIALKDPGHVFWLYHF